MSFFKGPRQPFVGLVLAAASGIFLGDMIRPSHPALVIGGLVSAVAAMALLWRPQVLFTYLLVGWSFFVLHTVRTTDTAGLRFAARLGERPRVVIVTGAVVSEPKFAANGMGAFLMRLNTVELESKSQATHAVILVHWRGSPEIGDELRLFGTATPIAPPRNPGEFDMRSYLARRDVLRALFVRYDEDGVLLRHGGGNPVLQMAQQSRAWLQQTLCHGLDDSPEVKDFISGITLGLRHETPEDIEEPFQQTGTLHLFAVAGLHVGIVAQLLWTVGRVSRLSRRWAAALIIPSLLFYSAVTGLHISSVRAAVMSAVLLGGFIVERRAFTLNSLAAAAMILLTWNTNELFATGFQLSFAVVGAIVLLADPMAKLFERFTAPDPFLPRNLLTRFRKMVDSILVFVGKSASVSIAAWGGSLLLIFWYFHLVTPISLLANLAVVPIAFLILAVALLSVATAPLLPWLSVVFNNANWFLARLVLGLVHLFAMVPGGHYYVAHPPWFGDAVAKIDILDLGAGAAVHLQTRDGDWLFDCGSDRDYPRVVRDYLHAAGVNRLRGLLLTHGDSLHIGGTTRLLSDLPPAILIDNPAPDRSTVHRRLRRLFEERGLTTRSPAKGESFQIGNGINCTVLYPPVGFSAPVADDQALVVQLRCGERFRLLFVSDSGRTTETNLLGSGLDLRSDILIKGQHHSGQSATEEFLDAVQPRLIVATSRDFPERERISDEWADRIRSRGIKLFRQDETGAVAIRLWPGKWEARAYATGETFRSSSR